MEFTYVLPGWEGSAANSRIIKDALLRTHPIRIPRGTYYLVDAGYTNGEGFLAPYRGQREIKFDPLEPLLDTDYGRKLMNADDDGDSIDVVESSIAWTLWRDNLARQMFDNWRLRRGAQSTTI
ncbi:unnamed protein product [Amaranthus hypochondriacus]